jgi:hypothetical protein
MLSALTPLLRPAFGNQAGATAGTDAATTPPQSAPPQAGAPAPVDAGGSTSSGFGGSASQGAYVPPLAVSDEGSGSAATPSNSSAAAAYAENGADDGETGGEARGNATPAPATDPLSGRPATRWMSASVTQPDAVSFTPEGEEAPQGGAVAERAAALAAQLGARVDYLVSSMKAAKHTPASQAIGSQANQQPQQASPAVRYATAAYIEF